MSVGGSCSRKILATRAFMIPCRDVATITSDWFEKSRCTTVMFREPGNRGQNGERVGSASGGGASRGSSPTATRPERTMMRRPRPMSRGSIPTPEWAHGLETSGRGFSGTLRSG